MSGFSSPVSTIALVSEAVDGAEAPPSGTAPDMGDAKPRARSPDMADTKPSRAMQSKTKAITLNVGGTEFLTAASTLRRERFFSALLDYHEDGEPIFVDRDPTHFRHILNFLRTGVPTAPLDSTARCELVIEAQFYGCAALARAIAAPAFETADHLDAATATTRRTESALRAALSGSLLPHACSPDAFFAAAAACGAPHVGLVRLLREAGAPASGDDVKWDDFPTGSDLRDNPQVLFSRFTTGTSGCVTTLDDFKANFNRAHANVLNRIAPILADGGLVIAGGAVTRALLSDQIGRRSVTRNASDNSWTGGSGVQDIDLFVCTRRAEEATATAKRVYDALAVDGERWHVQRGKHVINFSRGIMPHAWSPMAVVETTVQVVLRLYRSPAEVLLGFDVDVCCCAFDGSAVWALPRCARALRLGANVVNPLHAWPNVPSYELRLAKYALRGFAVIVPGLDRARIDWMRVRGDGARVHGLARLLRIENVADVALKEGGAPVLADVMTAIKKNYGVHAFQTSFYEHQWSCPIVALPGELEKENALHRTPLSSASVFFEDAMRTPERRDENPDDVAWHLVIPDIMQSQGTDDWPHGMVVHSAEVREAAWEDIVDAGVDALRHVPRLLATAWSNSPRSREHLNALEDDLDAKYYSQAYVDDDTAIQMAVPAGSLVV